MKADKISPARAATLRGKLGFAQQACFGRFGRAMATEILKRQYSEAKNRSLHPGLKRELLWWRRRIKHLPPRTLPYQTQKNNIVYSDASGGGGVSIGTMIIRHDNSSPPYPTHSGNTPKWCENANIFTLEIYAACLGAFHLSTLSGRGPCIFFIDNEAACSALVRGTTEDETARALISSFWRICTQNQIIPWIERVSSKNNPADAPSRGECSGIIYNAGHRFPEFKPMNSRETLIKFGNWDS